MKKQNLTNKKEIKGITLIALIITIIILLILAGVTIATLTGENGILAKTNTAKIQAQKKEVIESAQVDILGVQAGNEGEITKTQFIEVLEKYFVDTTIPSEGELPDDMSTATQEVTAKEEYGSYNIKISEIWSGKFSKEQFNPEKLKIGEPIDEDKYGWKVAGYDVEIDEVGCWRLFYKDTNYVYLISHYTMGGYKPIDFYDSYKYGSDVSVVGQRLNKMLLDKGTFFVKENENPNIRATAWLTDTSDSSDWAKYKNDDAVFAIGSPTVELYKASFDATASSNNVDTFSLEVGTYGYTHDESKEQLQVSFNKGIYIDFANSSIWIASPNGEKSYLQVNVYEKINYFYAYNVEGNNSLIRPVVCIPRSTFDSKYADSLVDE